MSKKLLVTWVTLLAFAGCDTPTETPVSPSPEARFSVSPSFNTANVKLDLFRDCDIGGCTGANPLDMQGPGDQGFVNYNQDEYTGDMNVTVHLQKQGAPNESYTLFLTCGPGGIGTPHSESCGFDVIGTLETNRNGIATMGVTVPKCLADALISGNPYGDGQQAHLDILAGAGDQSLGVFVATELGLSIDACMAE